MSVKSGQSKHRMKKQSPKMRMLLFTALSLVRFSTAERHPKYFSKVAKKGLPHQGTNDQT